MKTKMIIRYGIFLIGLLCTGIGVALSTKMGMGTTPISVIPFVISNRFPISFGMVANILGLTFVLLQFLIKRKNFTKDLYMQILIAPFFGYFVDIGFAIFHNLVPGSFEEQMLYLVLGCMTMAFGIYLQIMADVVVNPCEGLVIAIADRLKKKFGNVKIFVDVSVMLVGVLISLMIFGEVRGVGIATVVVALSTGFFTKMFKRVFDYIGMEWLFEKSTENK